MRITRKSGGGIPTISRQKKPQTFVRNCVALFDTASVKMAGKGEFMKVYISIISKNLQPWFLREKSWIKTSSASPETEGLWVKNLFLYNSQDFCLITSYVTKIQSKARRRYIWKQQTSAWLIQRRQTCHPSLPEPPSLRDLTPTACEPHVFSATVFYRSSDVPRLN